MKNISSEYVKKTRDNTQVWEAFVLRMNTKYSDRQRTIDNENADRNHSQAIRAAEDAEAFRWPSSLASCPLDGKPCCIAVHRATDGQTDNELELELEQMRSALSWCCTQIDCSPLHSYRRHPDHVSYHMDWAFTRYLRLKIQGSPNMLANQSALEEHCHFGGTGKLWFPTSQAMRAAHAFAVPEPEKTGFEGPFLECRPRPQGMVDGANVTEKIGKALEWLCGADVIGNCDGVMKELQLIGAISRQADETDLLYRARILFTLYYQAHWPFEADEGQEICSFDDTAYLHSPGLDGQPVLVTLPSLRGKSPFHWPTSFASCPADGLPCCRAIYRDNDSPHLDRMESALSWACGQIDCRPLHTYRSFPQNISLHMDWAFSHYLRKVVAAFVTEGLTTLEQLKENPKALEEHCKFGGVGDLLIPDVEGGWETTATHGGPAAECVPEASLAHPGSNFSEIVERSLETLCGAIISACDDIMKEIGRTGAVQALPSEDPLFFRARVLFTAAFQLRWQESSEACSFGGVTVLRATPAGG
jgi:hypothetical protein